ncbi:MAG: VanZ family protein [Candidatus Syntrophosphaera sp.]|nr:VanZ family protein [Candidatus Syntrophosphaera sp.]
MQDLKRKLTLTAPVVWLVLIWTVSSIPGKRMPSLKVISIDKLAHIGQYLVLGLLVNQALKSLRIRSGAVPWIYLALLLSAGFDEWHQRLIPHRSVSWWDFVANGIGLGIAFSFFWFSRDRSKEPTP